MVVRSSEEVGGRVWLVWQGMVQHSASAFGKPMLAEGITKIRERLLVAEQQASCRIRSPSETKYNLDRESGCASVAIFSFRVFPILQSVGAAHL